MKKLEMELLIKDQEMLMKEYSTGMRTFMFYSGFIEWVLSLISYNLRFSDYKALNTHSCNDF